MVIHQLLGGIAANVVFYMDGSSFSKNQVRLDVTTRRLSYKA